MSDTTTNDRDGNGTNSHPLDDTIAGTGPGIPDDALMPGEDGLPPAPTDEEVAAVAKKLGAPVPQAE
jgi:hypothetical protein